MGCDVDVFTRRDSNILPETAEWVNGVRIIHVPAGPPAYVRKEELLPYMKPFTEYMLQFCRCQRKAYDLIHANFWMSGLVATELKKQLGIPFVITSHALGRVRRQFQRQADEFPDERFEIEDRLVAEADHIIAEAPQDEEDLIRLYNADPANITMVPCGFDPTELAPMSKTLARISLGLPPDERVVLHLGRLVPRKGTETVIRAFGRLLHKHLVSARLLIGDHPRMAPLKTLDIDPVPVASGFFPSTAGVLHDHFEAWFITHAQPPVEPMPGLETTYPLGQSQEWLAPPVRAINWENES